MLPVVITMGVGLVTGTIAYFLAARASGPTDPSAPYVAPATISNEVRSHSLVARWLSKRINPTVATGSLLTGAVVLLVVGLGGVGILFAMVRAHRGFADFDHGVAVWSARHAATGSTDALRILTQFGGAAVLVPVTAAVALVELRRQRRWEVVAFLAVTVGGQYLLANLIKVAVGRARPDILRLTGFSGPSFPSGHATAASATFAALALVVGRRRPKAARAILAGCAVGLATSIAATRVLLGVHWLTDVLAGLCLGWAWFALCSIAFGGRLLRLGEPLRVGERVAERIGSSAEKD